jgi:hypothetical protein
MMDGVPGAGHFHLSREKWQVTSNLVGVSVTVESMGNGDAATVSGAMQDGTSTTTVAETAFGRRLVKSADRVRDLGGGCERLVLERPVRLHRVDRPPRRCRPTYGGPQLARIGSTGDPPPDRGVQHRPPSSLPAGYALAGLGFVDPWDEGG